MSFKVFRDPLYNYISIDQKKDGWLIELLDCPEVQRLRRIHQLGVSDFTYPGASHTRFSHSLGVLHLMQRMFERIEQVSEDASVRMCRERLLAAAVLHDVGHGPFSHLFEPCLGIDHESWSVKIVRNTSGQVNGVLRKVDPPLAEGVAQLIEKNNQELPQWQKFLLSSQIDVDRMDYLRRDSLFTGSGYGHFDWHRIINTLEFHGEPSNQRDIVWPEKAMFAIEEYIFSRYYMYQSVYLHKTTRGFEKLLEAMWNRAREMRADGTDVNLVSAIREFWDDMESVEKYLAIEEHSVLQQIQQWQSHPDKSLSDLAGRFMNRGKFAMVEAPARAESLTDGYEEWEAAMQRELKSTGFDDVATYCLRDQVKKKYNQPYFPEKQNDEQSAKNAIRIRVNGESQPVEISKLLHRLEPLTTETQDRYRYYVPMEVRNAIRKLKETWSVK